MAGILKDIPLEGKVVRLKEDTVWGGFGRQNLRIILIIENDVLRMNQLVAFIRPGVAGDILTTLINDFKDGKELNIKGTISYSLYTPGFGPYSGPKKPSPSLKRLEGTTDWQKISEDDKEALKEFLSTRIAPYWGGINLQVSVGNRVKYLIRASDDTIGGADIYLQ